MATRRDVRRNMGASWTANDGNGRARKPEHERRLSFKTPALHLID